MIFILSSSVWEGHFPVWVCCVSLECQRLEDRFHPQGSTLDSVSISWPLAIHVSLWKSAWGYSSSFFFFSEQLLRSIPRVRKWGRRSRQKAYCFSGSCLERAEVRGWHRKLQNCNFFELPRKPLSCSCVIYFEL